MITLTLTKRHLITGVLATLFSGFMVAWWFVSNYKWVFAVGAILVLITAMVLWFLNRDESEVRKQKQLEKQDLQLI